MAVTVSCPNSECGKTYRVSEDLIGRRVKCQQCGEVFQAAAPDEGDAGAAGPAEGPSTQSAVEASEGFQFLHLERRGEVTLVRVLAKRINSDNVEAIGAELLSLPDDDTCRKVVLNLADVEFLFSTAIGKIVSLEKKLTGAGGALRLCSLQKLVHESLESAGLTMLLDVHPDEAAALAGW